MVFTDYMSASHSSKYSNRMTRSCAFITLIHIQ